MTLARRSLLGLAAAMAPLSLAGCGLSTRPYVERREWPMVATRPSAVPARRDAPVLLVRQIRAGPAVEARGLQTLQPDGSVDLAFYEEWAVTPAEGVDAALRGWLEASGMFSAVTAPGSRLAADRILEAELTEFATDPHAGEARATLTFVVISGRGENRPLLQRRETGRARLSADTAEAKAGASLAALSALLGQVETDLRSVA